MLNNDLHYGWHMRLKLLICNSKTSQERHCLKTEQSKNWKKKSVMEQKVSTALIKRDSGKVWGSTMPLLPSKTNQNEAKEEILGHPTGKIRGKSRGGVEDTRLEAKYQKKSDAKTKDRLSEQKPSQKPKTQGASVLQKKRPSNKFSRRPPKTKKISSIIRHF